MSLTSQGHLVPVQRECHYYKHTECIRMSPFQKAWSCPLHISVWICLSILMENSCNTSQKQYWDWTGWDFEKQISGIQRLWECYFFQAGEHWFECNFKPALYRKGEKDEACTPSEWQSMIVSQSIPTLSGWAFSLQGSWRCRLTIQVICRSRLH